MSFTSVFTPEQMYSAKSGSPPAGKGREAMRSALYDYTCGPLGGKGREAVGSALYDYTRFPRLLRLCYAGNTDQLF